MEMELGKLFVGGISWDTNEDRLKDYFQSFGEVVEAVIMKDRATGRARGFGFIVFADPLIAERVVMEKHVIDGRTVEAKKAVPRDDHNNLNRNNSSMHGSPSLIRTKKIFVGGLASTVTENDFKNYFDQFGIITDVVVMYDHNTQRPRGFGFITYDSEEAVERVLHKTFHELNGKMVEVKRAIPKELSPVPSRSPLSYGLVSRASSLVNGYTHGFNQSPAGGYGRFSPVSTVGRNGFTQFDPLFGMGLNIMEPSNGRNANYNSHLNYGQLDRFTNEGNSSLLSSMSRSLWGETGLNYSAANSTGLNAIGSRNGNTPSTTMGSIDSLRALWGFRSEDIGSIGRNRATSRNGGFEGVYSDNYNNSSFYNDLNWQPSPLRIEEGTNSLFGLGFGNSVSDAVTNNSASYAAVGYGVANRQSHRGIAA